MYFGGVDIIFCVDFYQAQPIQDSLIFENPIINKENIPYNFLKDMVTCYQLQTTMRQKNVLFISILNKMQTNSQTNYEIEYVNKKCFRQPPIDPTFPYLFHTNKLVNLHNQRMLFIVHSEPFIINVIDEIDENYGNVT